ncbi:MAG: hypothetical protein IH933_00825 [Euryarchaeota archaeon]|nr:hypothetical protein [Euryarchaeota archaeon]
MQEFGDADGLTRSTAELVSLGYAGAADLDHQVTIDYEGRTYQGQLYLDWDFSTLAPAEYDQDGETLTLYHVSEGAEYTVETDDSETFAYDDFSFEDDDLGDDDRHEGTVSLSSSDDVEDITVDAEGSIRSYLPVGSSIDSDDYSSGIFARINSDGNVTRQSMSGDWELEEVIDGDGKQLDYLALRGYNTVSRDPALSLDEQRERARNRDDDLDSLSTGGGGGGFLPSLEGIGAAGVAAIAGIGFVAYKALQNHPANRLR